MGDFVVSIIWVIVIISLVRQVLRVYASKSGNADIIRVTQNPFKEFFKKFNVGTTQRYNSSKADTMNNIKGKIFLGIGSVIIIFILMNIFVVIPTGETGVRTLFGKVKDRELTSGIHVINPLEHIERMTIRTEEYTMSIAQGEGQKVGADQISALTNEGLPIDLDITVFYHLNEGSASDVYRTLGTNYQEKIIRPEIRSAIREVVARYDAKDVYSEKRGEVADEIRMRMVETIEPRGIGVEQVLLRNVTLPEKLSASIQEKLQAEQESQRYEFVLQKEAKEAERKRLEAAGQRDAQAIINESLTPKYLQYLYIKELKEREGTIYVPTGSDGLPLFKSVE